MPSMFGTMTIGEVVDALARAEPGATVQFDFCYTSPTTVHSYRGWYDHLAIGWEVADTPKHAGTYWPLASDIKDRIADAIGREFQGYKGGEYVMRRDTPIWVDNHRDASSTGIVEIECNGSSVIIHTKHMDI